MNDLCIITIYDDDYYINCDDIQYLNYIDGHLVNLSTYNLRLSNNFRSTSQTNYPYISCSSYSVCRLYELQNYDYKFVDSNYVYEGSKFKLFNFEMLIFCLLFILLGVKLLWKR